MLTFKEITPTGLLTAGINVVWLTVLSLISLTAITSMIYVTYSVYEHKARVEQIDTKFVGDAHLLMGTDCIVLVDHAKKENYVNAEEGSACGNFARKAENWRSYKVIGGNPPSVGEVLFAIIVGLVMVAATYPLIRLPAFLLAVVIPPLRAVMPLLTLISMLPAILFMIVFITSAWQSSPSGWTNGTDVVQLKRVCVTDEKMYSCPSGWVEWFDPNAGAEIGYHYMLHIK